MQIVARLFESKIAEKIEKYRNRDENVIWVSELVQCKQKAELSKQFYILDIIEPRFVLGDLVHVGMQEFLGIYYNAETEVEFEKDLENYTISGRVDAIIGDTVIEIKYCSDLYENQPYEHHVQQLKLYLWLTEKEKGKLIYISPKRIVEFDVEGKPSDDEVLMLIDTWKSPRYEWECSYCPFAKICSKAIVKEKR